jgi:hypothetical protein
MNRYIIDKLATMAIRAAIAEARVQVVERENVLISASEGAWQARFVEKQRQVERLTDYIREHNLEVP